MEVDGEKGDVEMASDSESENDMNSSDDEAKENEYNQKKIELQERVSCSSDFKDLRSLVRSVFILIHSFQIRNDKTDYYGYIELIQVLSHLGQLDELRKVREDFSKEYPLTPGYYFKNLGAGFNFLSYLSTVFNFLPALWKSWIEDEKKIATTVEEKEHIKSLFERALQDYLCKN